MKKIVFDYDFINPVKHGVTIGIEITKRYSGFCFVFVRVYLNY